MRKKLGKVFGIIFVVLMVLSFTLNVRALESSGEEVETIEKEVKETNQVSVSKSESNEVVQNNEIKKSDLVNPKTDSITLQNGDNVLPQKNSGTDVKNVESIVNKEEVDVSNKKENEKIVSENNVVNKEKEISKENNILTTNKSEDTPIEINDNPIKNGEVEQVVKNNNEKQEENKIEENENQKEESSNEKQEENKIEENKNQKEESSNEKQEENKIEENENQKEESSNEKQEENKIEENENQKEESNNEKQEENKIEENENQKEESNNEKQEENKIEENKNQKIEDTNEKQEENKIEENENQKEEDNNEKQEENKIEENENQKEEDNNEKQEENKIEENENQKEEDNNEKVETLKKGLNEENNDDESDEENLYEPVVEQLRGEVPTEEVTTFNTNMTNGQEISITDFLTRIGLQLETNDLEITSSDSAKLEVANVEGTTYIKNKGAYQDPVTITIVAGGKEYTVIVDFAPDHSKGLIDNEDGTYTISLDVTGEAVTTKPNHVNVVVVLDTSYSMRNTYSGGVDGSRVPIAESTHYYTPSDETRNTMYGIVNGEFVEITRRADNKYYDSKNVEYKEQRYIDDKILYDSYGNGINMNPSAPGYPTVDNENENRRIYAAKYAVQKLALDLLSRNGVNGADDDAVEMALVTFDRVARIDLQPTTDLADFVETVSKLVVNKGTNWEAALRAARTIDFNDDDTTFIVFVTDGNPTNYMHSSLGSDTYTGTYTASNGNNIAVNADGTTPHANSQIQGDGNESGNGTVTNSYNASKDEVVDIVQNRNYKFYSIGAYGLIDNLKRLTSYGYYADNNPNNDTTVDEVHPVEDEGKFFNATSTSALNSAFDSILEAIKTTGFGSVDVNDGVTSSVEATSGSVSGGLLDVDDKSFKYYFSFPVTENEDGTLTSNIDYITSIVKDGDNYKLTNKNGKTVTVKRVTAYDFDSNGVQNKSKVLNNVFKFEWSNNNNPFHLTNNQGKPVVSTTEDGKPVPAEYIVNDSVRWNLSELGVLIDGVTYTVTFDCWPSQATLDLIADLKNDIVEYYDYPSTYIIYDKANDKYTLQNNGTSTVITEEEANDSSYPIITLDNKNYYKDGKLTISPEIAKYLLKDGDNYTLLTNTDASLSFKDTRVDDTTPYSSDYENPDPVSTDAVEMFAISKEWIGTREEADKSITLYIDRDGEVDPKIYNINLHEDDDDEKNYKGSIVISIGIITVDDEGNINLRTTGHDYSFSEDIDISWRWELTAPTVRPMLINNVVTTLLLLDEAPTNAVWTNDYGTGTKIVDNQAVSVEYYKITDCKTVSGEQVCTTKYYEVGPVGTAILTATNSRRTNLDVKKVITNGKDGDDSLFTYTATVITNEDTTKAEDFWFSVWDTENKTYIMNGDTPETTYITNATAEVKTVDTTDETVTSVSVDTDKKEITIIYSDETTKTDSYMTLSVDGTKYSYITGYYYAKSGETVTIKLKGGTMQEVESEDGSTSIELVGAWSLRFLNLPTGSKYTISESGMNPEYAFEDLEVTYKDPDTGSKVTDDTVTITETDETEVTGTVSLANNLYTVLYSNKVRETSVKVTKEWSANANQDGAHPASVQVQLLAGGEAEGSPVTLNEDNNWTYTWNK